MKMNRIYDDETNEVTYRIPSFPFSAVISVTPSLPTNRMVALQDSGGTVLVMQTSEGQAEALAIRKLWEFYNDNL